MHKAILLASAIITFGTFAGSVQAAGFKGSYWSQTSYAQRYERRKEARAAAQQKIATDKVKAQNASINAGMQKSGDKYDAAMNAAENDLKSVVIGTSCLTCR